MGFDNITLIILILVACTAVSMFIPKMAYEFSCYKCRKNGKEITFKQVGIILKTLCVVTIDVYALLVIVLVPTQLIALTILFGIIGVFGSFVDRFCRIIANEMVLVLLVLGIVYRVLTGGNGLLLGSIAALVFTTLIFYLASVVTKLRTGVSGVGMGDVKLSMVISIMVGWPGIIFFFIGLGVSIAIYSLGGLKLGFFTLKDTFPMCLPIVLGWLYALIYQYIPYVHLF